MKYSVAARAGALACLALASVQAVAIEPFQEYKKRVESSQNIAALNDGLFGDSVNLYNGQTTFTSVDIDIPGNFALPVQLTRRFSVQLRVGNTQDTSLGGAGGWDVDVPYIAGTFGPVSGWKTDRCSNSFVPSVTSGFLLTEIWQGNSIHVPGGTDRNMLGSANSQMPSDGATHKITTSERDVFSCTPMKSGLAGEGYVMKTTSGVKYYFDTAVSRFAAQMTRQVGDKFEHVTSRSRVYVLATKVEDRFGNTVEYAYNANGNPTRIWSSDGREIVLTYSNGQLATATANGKTWTYQYTTFQSQPRLSNVVLPDASQWKYAYSGELYVPDQMFDGGSDNQCLEQPPESQASFTLTATHPSNAVGTFAFGNARHYRSGVHVSECLQRTTIGQPMEPNTYYWILNTPYFFDVMSLGTKTISGPGVATQTWGYNYGGSFQTMWGSRATAANYPCTTCATEKTVTVTQPDGVKTRYRYGFLYALNEGRVLGVDTVATDNTVKRSESTDYLSEADAPSQNFADRYGTIFSGDDPSTARVRPVVKKTIVQDGVTFISQVDKGTPLCGATATTYCFNLFARPTRESKFSSLGQGTKVEKTDYHENLVTWVLGQVKLTHTNNFETSQTDYNGSDLPIRVYENQKLKQTFTYNADGTFATVSDGRDGVGGMETTVTLSNWKRGTPQLITYPATPEAPGGSTMSAVVNDDGSLASTTDENASKTCYKYDGAGRLEEILYPSETAANTCNESRWLKTTLSFVPVASTEYGLPANHWKRTVSTGNARQVTYVDAYWRPVVEEKYDAANVAGTRSITVKRYDQGNQLEFQSYPVASLTTYLDAALKGTWTEYDALDRVTSNTQDSELGLLVTATTYESGFKQAVTNPRGKVTRTSYKVYDQPSTDLISLIEHPEGAFTQIDRVNPLDQPTLLRRRNSTSSVQLDRSYVYDPTYQTLCKTVEPETGATVTNYDMAGNLILSAPGLTYTATNLCNLTEAASAPSRATRTYDARNRVTSLAFTDGRGNVQHTYEKNGLPKSLVTHNDGLNANVVTTDYAYNRRGLLEGETMTFGSIVWPINYEYSANAHLSSQTYHGLLVDYAPNALGQATKAGSYATGVTYYPNGGIKQFTYGNGIHHTMSQNARGLPRVSCDTVSVLAPGSCNTGAFLNDTYTYDQNGNVTGIDDSRVVEGVPNRTDRTMTYDGLDRLTKTVSPMYGNGVPGEARYTYDVLDNITSAFRNTIAGENYRDWSYYYDPTTRRLANILDKANSNATVIALDYDDQGNMEQKSIAGSNNFLFDFDHGNRLRKTSRASTPSAQTVTTYLYDGLGRRIRDYNTGVTGGIAGSKYSQYSKDGQLLQVSDARNDSNFNEYIYLAGSLVAVRERTGAAGAYVYAVKYQHTDALGSPAIVSTESRGYEDLTEYEPYGRVLKPQPLKDGPGYTGHVLDAATELNYMQQRYYDPQIGRFLSVDPVTANCVNGSNFNRYWYANNNPYRFTDPDGRLSRGTGWTDKQWKTFDRAQQSAAGSLEKAAGKLTSAMAAGGKALQKAEKAFEKNFGAGSATPENMAKAASDMGAMAAALRNTGEGAIPANAMTGAALAAAYPNVGADTLAGVPTSGPTQVLVNISHASFGNASVLAWGAGHETAHAVLGYKDQKVNGISAYKFGSPEQQQIFNSLPGAQRLINPDHLMDQAR